jgi:hypothetical protein
LLLLLLFCSLAQTRSIRSSRHKTCKIIQKMQNGSFSWDNKKNKVIMV